MGAVTAAVVAGRSATRAKRAELDATRIADLERRLAAARTEVFEPFVEAIGLFFDSINGQASASELSEILTKPLLRFINWAQIYGSDDTVRAAMHFMQGTFHDAPEFVGIRLI
jgi:hypothetical protein